MLAFSTREPGLQLSFRRARRSIFLKTEKAPNLPGLRSADCVLLACLVLTNVFLVLVDVLTVMSPVLAVMRQVFLVMMDITTVCT